MVENRKTFTSERENMRISFLGTGIQL